MRSLSPLLLLLVLLLGSSACAPERTAEAQENREEAPMDDARAAASGELPDDASADGGTSAEGSGEASDARPALAPDAGVPVTGWRVQRQEVGREVRFTGTVETVERIHIAPRRAGILLRLDVREGDRVARGDLLGQLDSAELRAERGQLRAELAAEVQRRDRLQALVGRDAAPAAELEELESRIAVWEARLQLVETRIRLGRVEAPASGTVLARYAAQGSSVRADEPILELADLDALVVRAHLSERDVIHLQEGQEVSFALDADPQRTLAGRLARILPDADPRTRLVPVEFALELESPAGADGVRPGFLVRATLSLDAREGLFVPAEALLASAREDRFVYRIHEDTLERQAVVTGIERRNLVEVLEGLEEGDIVVGTNPTNLRPESAVRVTRWLGEDE